MNGTNKLYSGSDSNLSNCLVSPSLMREWEYRGKWRVVDREIQQFAERSYMEQNSSCLDRFAGNEIPLGIAGGLFLVLVWWSLKRFVVPKRWTWFLVLVTTVVTMPVFAGDGIVRVKNNASYQIYAAGPNGSGTVVGANGGRNCFYSLNGGCQNSEGAGCAITVRSNSISGPVLGNIMATVTLSGGADNCNIGNCSGVCTTNLSEAVWSGTVPTNAPVWCIDVGLSNPDTNFTAYFYIRCADGQLLATETVAPETVVVTTVCRSGGPCDLVIQRTYGDGQMETVANLLSNSSSWHPGGTGGGGGSPDAPVVGGTGGAVTNSPPIVWVNNTGASTNLLQQGTFQQGVGVMHLDNQNLLGAVGGLGVQLTGISNAIAAQGGGQTNFLPTLTNEVRGLRGDVTNFLRASTAWTNPPALSNWGSTWQNTWGATSHVAGGVGALTNLGGSIYGNGGTNITGWAASFGTNWYVPPESDVGDYMQLKLFEGAPYEQVFDLNPARSVHFQDIIPCLIMAAKWVAAIYFLVGAWRVHEEKILIYPLVRQVEGAKQGLGFGFNLTAPTGIMYATLITAMFLTLLASWGATYAVVSTVINAGPFDSACPEIFRKGIVFLKMLFPLEFCLGLLTAYWVWRTAATALYAFVATLIRFMVS